MTCIKFLCNIFKTKWGENLLYNLPSRCVSIVKLCTKSFLSINPKIVSYATGLLINMLMGIEKQDCKDAIQELLCDALMNITQAIST